VRQALSSLFKSPYASGVSTEMW